MSGDINNDNIDPNRRKRPIPVPLYDDRYIERPYLKKIELAKIRDNLDELVDIKKTELFKDDNPKIEKTELEIKKSEQKSNISDINISDTNIPNITNVSPPVISDKSIPNQSIINSESKKEEIKIGISNLVDNKKIDDKKQQIQQTIVPKENSQKIIKRKVIRMSSELSDQYNISPEDRRRLRKSEIKEFQDEEETARAVRKAAELAEQNTRELKEFKLNLAKENEEIKKDLKAEISNKFGQVDQKFNDITGRFDKVSTKLEETCTGIDCLKKDLAKINKNIDLIECPECGEKVVPPLASFCPSCSAKISGWQEDDGTPVKNWKPNWEK